MAKVKMRLSKTGRSKFTNPVTGKVRMGKSTGKATKSYVKGKS